MTRKRIKDNLNKNLTSASVSNAKREVFSLINNNAKTLRDSLNLSLSTDKDFNCVYGYPETISADEFWRTAERNPIASFVADGIANDCWSNGFELADCEGSLIKEVNEQLKIMSRNGLFKDLARADKMNRRNRYSIGVVMLNDGRSLDQEIGTATDISSVKIKPYRESGINISQRETDPTNIRYGLPTLYQAQVVASGNDSEDTDLSTVKIHWTRVILFNEGQMDSVISGESSLKPIYNDLINLQKSVGGSSEAYFRNAFPKYSLKTDDAEFNSAYFESDEVQKGFDKAANDFINGAKPFIVGGGVSADPLNTPHASPKDTVTASLWNISANTGVPIRILTGEGSGQLAGSEDKLKYGVVINDRQNNECSCYVYQLIKILSNAGLIDVQEDYQVKWPVEEPTTEKQKADIAAIKADVLQKISAALSPMTGLSGYVTQKQAMEEILEWDYEPGDVEYIAETEEIEDYGDDK
tara:strand:+ start:9191 stop:10600 length:1410 start_codon:yes stop_codon:yes gene_type:complete